MKRFVSICSYRDFVLALCENGDVYMGYWSAKDQTMVWSLMSILSAS